MADNLEPRASALVSRLLDYAAYDTQSSESSAALPSTPGQLRLARHLADELRAMGASDVHVSEGGYVYARVPASEGRGGVQPLGFLAHVDTSPDAPGANVKPSVIRYNGGVVELGESGKRLDPAVFPELSRHEGRHLVVTDGTTLLGADDKAGVAIVMEAASALLAPSAPPHGEIRIAFTPDEEIGQGTRGFEPERFGARIAFTVDGDNPAMLETENFNAASAKFAVRGVSVHPGSAKGVMVNAARIAAEIIDSLPENECPEQTEGREGFYHPTAISGGVSEAAVEFIVRDHDKARFEARKETLAKIAAGINARFGEGTVTLTIADQYRNMAETIEKTPFLVEEALAAVRSVGLAPEIVAIRGGTDGAKLAEMGIPCPNLGTGGRNFHGELEYAVVEEMEKALGIVLALARMRHVEAIRESGSSRHGR